MLKLYDFMESGNGYKVRLLLTQLGRPYELILVDILKGESRTPEFLKKNPNGRIPVLELDDGTCLPESNAIIWYLADGTPFMPSTPMLRAQALRWMCFEQYSHEPNIATVRFWTHYPKDTEDRRVMMPIKRQQGYAALKVMEGHLKDNDYFVGGAYSIADIALFAYTHVAHEGGFDLAPYKAVNAWIERVAAQPHHIPITQG
jgi:glutathione S-transferase